MLPVGNGLLLVLMQPPAALEEEFNAWYDTEHLPERAALPGFRSARRFVCVSGYPRYMAIYDLDRMSVLDSPEYMAVSADRFSPWTKRVISRVQVYRVAAEQIYPGDATTGTASRCMLLRFTGVATAEEEALAAALRSCFGGLTDARQLRLFRGAETEALRHFAAIEFSLVPRVPLDFSQLGDFAHKVDLENLYVPYGLELR